MVTREHVGWDEPFLGKAVGWLLGCRGEWPGMVVVVPTGQAGRRLREALAERCGACLVPRVMTPGQWLKPVAGRVAGRAVEVAAWVEVLGGVLEDAEEFGELLPVMPEEWGRGEWAAGLAKTLVELRRELQESALTLEAAAQRLAATEDGGRWRQLAVLERRAEELLGSWGLVSRNAALAAGLAALPVSVSRVVLAGVMDAPPAVRRAWRGLEVPVHALVGAPASEAQAFDDLGMPLVEVWAGRVLPWPGDERVEVAADPRQQAEAALRRVAAAGTASNDVALGSADEETAGELVRVFGREGWVLHDPAGCRCGAGAKWLALWRRWLAAPVAGAAMDLLGMPATARLVGGRRAQRARALSAARDRWLVTDAEDLERVRPLAREKEQESLGEAAEAMRGLGQARDAFSNDGMAAGFGWLREVVETAEPAAGGFLGEWWQGVADVVEQTGHEPEFWLDLLLDEWPRSGPEPPEGRVGDVQGWLELFHEPGRHLVVCGMNEGLVPENLGADAWLSESTRGLLGLGTDAERAARDACLFTAMVEARRAHGRVDLLLAKATAGGDPLLPSRLLLGAAREELAGRVGAVFREVEPPDAALVWNADWKWRPRDIPLPDGIRVTAFADYLACPFRYYLKHVARMSAPEPERPEWNARDFGTMAHLVLETWARDPEWSDMNKAEAIEERLLAILADLLAKRFGPRPPLAVRIQAEGLRQRLCWFARIQAVDRVNGWRISEVERPITWQVGGLAVSGTVDRLDIHADGRRRVLDYKTGKVDSVERAHRVKVGAATRRPAHLAGVEEVLCEAIEKGKPVTKTWRNLQVPVYAAALGEVAELGYFALGPTEAQVKVSLWEDFRDEDRESAVRCAEWVVGRIREGVFWPPAERVNYDDLGALAARKTLDAVFETLVIGGGR